MLLEPILESEMKFGLYDSDDLFHIEKSTQYCRNIGSNGIKISEFILYKDNKILVVEAKKTCPNVENKSADNEQRFVKYVQDIVDKFENSLDILANIYIGRIDSTGISSKFLPGFEYKLRNYIILILVVKNAKEEWLVSYPDALKKQLNKKMRIWKIRTLLVINEEKAREKGLVM